MWPQISSLRRGGGDRKHHFVRGTHLRKNPQPTCSSGERGHGRRSTQDQSTADPRTPTFIESFAEVTTLPLLTGPSGWKEQAEKATKQSNVSQRDVG